MQPDSGLSGWAELYQMSLGHVQAKSFLRQQLKNKNKIKKKKNKKKLLFSIQSSQQNKS